MKERPLPSEPYFNDEYPEYSKIWKGMGARLSEIFKEDVIHGKKVLEKIEKGELQSLKVRRYDAEKRNFVNDRLIRVAPKKTIPEVVDEQMNLIQEAKKKHNFRQID